MPHIKMKKEILGLDCSIMRIGRGTRRKSKNECFIVKENGWGSWVLD